MSPIDARAPRFNQAVVAVALAAGFLLDLRVVVPVAALVLFLSALGLGPLLLFWRRVVAPRVGPPRDVEDPRPPRFAAAVGTAFLAASTLSFVAGASPLGWALALLVAALAGLAAATGICVGCEVYVFWRRRTGGGWAPLS